MIPFDFSNLAFYGHQINIQSYGRLVFSSYGYALAFIIVILSWILTEIIGARIIPSRQRGSTKVEKPQKRVNIIDRIGWVIYASILFSGAAPAITLLPTWMYFLGIALMVTGIIIRQWAIAVLGKYFSGVIGVQKEQKVVQTGPYRLIRHPSYTGILLLWVGAAFAFQSWLALLGAGLIFGLAYGHRIVFEEKFLIKELGENYVEYMKSSKRIIPFLI